jgi:hypothetical protein
VGRNDKVTMHDAKYFHLAYQPLAELDAKGGKANYVLEWSETIMPPCRTNCRLDNVAH